MINQAAVDKLELELAQLGKQIDQVEGWCMVYESKHALPPEKFRKQLSSLRNKASDLTAQLMVVAQAK